jgi:hypothetical protein
VLVDLAERLTHVGGGLVLLVRQLFQRRAGVLVGPIPFGILEQVALARGVVDAFQELLNVDWIDRHRGLL